MAEPVSGGASEVRRFADGEALADAVMIAVAQAWVKQSEGWWITPGWSERGEPVPDKFSLVLAGGSTPQRVYELLGDDGDLPWDAIHLWWSDERCVPPDDPLSNYGMARRAMLDRVGVWPQNVHRIRGEADPAQAADEMDAEIRARVGVPRFHVALLGMGEDGHTASLFPGHAALAETSRWAVAVETDAKAPRWRVTLTIPALASAGEVWFLVTGAAKRPVLTEILRDPAAAAARYPAAAVASRARRVVWFADAAALA